jgi:hypothetical protein
MNKIFGNPLGVFLTLLSTSMFTFLNGLNEILGFLTAVVGSIVGLAMTRNTILAKNVELEAKRISNEESRIDIEIKRLQLRRLQLEARTLEIGIKQSTEPNEDEHE